MKEAFFGVLIVLLGLIGIVIIQAFQNITVTNDQTYYLLKEVAEASMLDSIDLTYYRTKGKIRIVEDKFVENMARRFAESVNLSRDYNIIIHDVIEDPPKISLSIGTYVFSLQGDKFNIGQSLDSIIEAKFTSEEVGGVVVTPGEIEDPDDEEEDTYPENPDNPDEDLCPVCEVGDPNCGEISECITGDLKFVSWGNVTIPSKVCPTDPLANRIRVANYDICECGKWKEQSEDVVSAITKTATQYTYTWHFLKSTNIRTLDVTSTKLGNFDKCTTGITCPDTKVEIGATNTITPTYIPSDAVNRGLTWTSSDTSVATIQYPDPNTIGPTGISKATVTGKKAGRSVITVKTSNNNTDTCNVDVVDWDCPTTTMEMFESSSKQATLKGNITVPGMTWSISNTSIATINRTTGMVTAKAISSTNPVTINYTVNAPGFTSLTCPLKVKPIEEPDTTPTGCTPGSISVRWDTKNKWPNKKGPTLCPQDFEYVETCNPVPYGPPQCSTSKPAISKLGMSYDTASYCGYNGGYTYPEKASWDKTVSLNSMLITNGEERVNESNHTYSVTFTHTFTYNGWNTDVGPYTTGVNNVTRSYTITGSLLDRTNNTCKASTQVTPMVFVNNCPTGGLVNGTSPVTLTADRYSATVLDDTTARWTTSNSSIVKIVSGGSDPLSSRVQAAGVGTATITYSIKRKDTGATISDTCSINVYPACSSVYISGLSTIDKYDVNDYSVSPSFGGEAAWSTSNSGVLRITSDTSVYNKVISTKGVSAGKSTLTIKRRVDGCTKTKTITVRQTYKCPIIDGYQTIEYPINTNYCYTLTKPAPFSCSSSYPYKASNGYCYASYEAWYYSNGNAPHILPSVCTPWSNGYLASKQRCYWLYKKVES